MADVYSPTTEDLTSNDPRKIVLASMGALPPAPPLDASAAPRPTPTLALPPPAPADVTAPLLPAPAVVPKPLAFSRWSLTKPQDLTHPGPGYLASSIDPDTGQPSIANPSLTKLGKLFTVLRAAGQGAAVGSTQPTFGRGFMAADQFNDQQIQEHQRQQAASMALETQRQNLQMVPTAYGPLPMSIAKLLLPKEIQGDTARDVAEINTGSREKVARLLNGSRESIAKYNADSRAKIAGVQGVEVDPAFAQKYNIPPEFIGTKIKMTDLAALNRSSVFEDVPLMTAAGPIIVNRRTAQARPVEGEGGQTYAPPALASPKEVADLNNPGQTIVLPAGQTFGLPGTQSASVQVPRQEMKAEVPKDIGLQKVAFNTALQHADLLETAARALHNNDWQTLNGLENGFANEFGATGPVTAQVIAEAYTREVQKMLTSNHVSDQEIDRVGRTLDPLKQNLEQVLDVLKGYRRLATSKLNMLNQQAQYAVDKSQPKKPKTPAAPTESPKDEHPVGFHPL